MIRLFEGASRANAYQLSRPNTPEKVVEKTIDYMKERNPLPQSGIYNYMIDVGCGSGQSTAVFAPYFKRIVGIDVSEKQIKEANKVNKHTNVTYKVGQAEDLGDEQNVDLITSGQAVHWVNFDLFFKECGRVLNPKGCLLLHTYDRPRIYPRFPNDNADKLNAIADNLLTEFHRKCLFHPRRKHVDNHYQEIFEMINSKHKITDTVSNTLQSNFSDFISYLKTWSGYEAYMVTLKENKCNSRNDFKGDILQDFVNKLRKEWNISDNQELTTIPITLVWDIAMILSERPYGECKTTE